MNFRLDEYAHLDSPLHRWETRCKLLAFGALIIAWAWIDQLWLIPLILLLTALIYRFSRLPLRFLLLRLQYPGTLMLLGAIVLPFVAGSTVLLQFGPLALRQEGLVAVLLIAARFLSILTLSLTLFGTSSLLGMLRAMQALGLPALLADLALLFLRYLYDTAEQLTAMQTAMQLRGFERARGYRRLPLLAALVGSLLTRSAARSERVYHAMILRGYGQPTAPPAAFPFRSPDAQALYGVVLLAVAVIGINVWMR